MPIDLWLAALLIGLGVGLLAGGLAATWMEHE